MSDTPKSERSLFLEAIERSPEERAAFLNAECGENERLRLEVEALLRAHDQSGDLLDTPDATSPMTCRSITEKPGTQIGPYKLLEPIDQGGMGVVYLAEQAEPVRRQVALKIIKPGMDTQQVIKRFEAERQALALMDHPNIAKVFDAGATETGRPYFVMEWVKGVPITQYCDEHRLTPRERLEIFATVCQAVQHSHQKGIIHRDIKPSNVLVSESDGRPIAKVIDFGLAKAMGPQLIDKTAFTQQGQILGTVEYMSPEQADLNPVDVDTRTDIYSLGVLLYELLTGETPFDRQRLRSAAFNEILRIIREEEPPKPSIKLSSSEALASIAANRHCEPKKLGTTVRGELDWIVMKALEKDRSRRYETANGLASDINRYLNDEAVDACPPSAAYRFKKFARRNKATLVSTATILLCLIAGIAGTSLQAIRATAERDRATALEREARTETARANAVLELVEEMLASADPDEARGKDYTVRELLDQFSAGMEDRLKGQPEVEATIRALIGKAYLRLAPEDAESHLKTSLELRRRVLGPTHRDVADSLLDYGWCLWESKDHAGAERYGREALAVYRAVTGNAEPMIAAMRLLQLSLQQQGKDTEVESIAHEAMALADRSGPIETGDLASMLHILGSTMRDLRGELAEAEAMGVRAVDMHRRTHGNRHPETAWALCNLSGSSKALGKHAEATRYRREALAIFRLNYRDDHKSLRGLVEGLTRDQIAQQDYAAAEELWRETVAIRRRQFGNEHVLTANALSHLGHVLELMGDQAAAEAQYREALSIWQQLVDTGPQDAQVHCQMAEHYAERSQYDEAAEAYQKAAAIAPLSFDTAYYYALLCAVTENTERFREATSAMVQRYGRNSSTIIKFLTVWSCDLAPTAVENYELPIKMAHEIVDLNPESARFRVVQGAILHRAGRHTEAIECLTEVERRYIDAQQVTDNRVKHAWHFLAMAHHAAGNKDKAGEYLAKANDWTDTMLGDQLLAWYYRAELKVFRREAESVVKDMAGEANEREWQPKNEPVTPEDSERSPKG